MAKQPLSALVDIVNHIRLAWNLWRDRQVPLWPKGIPLLALAYVLWPIDFVADPILGLGQLDDLAILALGIKLFISLCPVAIVRQHLADIGVPDRIQPADEREIIDAPFRIIDE